MHIYLCQYSISRSLTESNFSCTLPRLQPSSNLLPTVFYRPFLPQSFQHYVFSTPCGSFPIPPFLSPFLLSPHCLLPLLPSPFSLFSLSLLSLSPLCLPSYLALPPSLPPSPLFLFSSYYPLPPSPSTNGIIYVPTLKELWTKVSSRSITTHFFLSVGAFGNSRWCLGPVYCCGIGEELGEEGVNKKEKNYIG